MNNKNKARFLTLARTYVLSCFVVVAVDSFAVHVRSTVIVITIEAIIFFFYKEMNLHKTRKEEENNTFFLVFKTAADKLFSFV